MGTQTVFCTVTAYIRYVERLQKTKTSLGQAQGCVCDSWCFIVSCQQSALYYVRGAAELSFMPITCSWKYVPFRWQQCPTSASEFQAGTGLNNSLSR